MFKPLPLLLPCVLSLFFASGCGNSSNAPAAMSTQSLNSSSQQEWVLAYSEDFENLSITAPEWTVAQPDRTDFYGDEGTFFRERDGASFAAPQSFKATLGMSTHSWLTIDSSTRNANSDYKALVSVEPDPAQPHNSTLRIASPEHSDSTVVRSTKPLPNEYRICTRAGFADFGTGYIDPGQNGYLGAERGEPWRPMPSRHENGFYWLAILSDVPGPHNNVWIHHKRKVVIDSDNNYYGPEDGGPWSHIWNGSQYVQSGEHPIMMFVLDPNPNHRPSHFDYTGAPFVSWAGGEWHNAHDVGQIRAAAAYKEREWYDVCVEKTNTHWTLSMTGDFRNLGQATLGGTMARELALEDPLSPDYFMMGDPHINFYRGLVYYDDLRLYLRPNTVW